MPGPEERIVQGLVRMLLEGTIDGGAELEEGSRPVLLQPDRSLSIYGQLIGWNGTRRRLLSLETDGTLEVANYGKDEASNLDALRTDPDRIQWTRPYDAYVQVDPVLIPSTEGVLWNPGSTAAQIYEVSFMAVNFDAGGAAVTISVGVDIAAGGSLATLEYWMFNEVLPYPGTTGWRGPFIIGGDDDVRGIASAANDAGIHFRIRRVDTGA